MKDSRQSKTKSRASSGKIELLPTRWKSVKKVKAKKTVKRSSAPHGSLFKSIEEVDDFVAGINARRRADRT